MDQRKSLTDILHGSDQNRLSQAWDKTEAAEDFVPLPAGQYIARVISGELFSSKTNATPGYKLTFQVTTGEHEGRRFWEDLWLTEAALPMTKRDLSKLGVTSVDQLDQPLPQGIRCKVKLVLHRDDDGTEYNRVRSFQVTGIEEPEPEPFAPADADAQEPETAADTTPAESDTSEADTSFNFGCNRQEGESLEGGA